MVRKALIVVDVQNDFLTGSLSLSSCPAKQDGLRTVPVINKLINQQEWDLVVYTFDWHPNNHLSFVTNAHKIPKHPDSPVTEKFEVYNKVIYDIDGTAREQVLWPPHCIQGSWGAELHKDLHVTKDGCRVYKGQNKHIDSYSAFYDNGKLSETNLRKLLLDNDVDTIYVCGVATDVCVSFTAIDGCEIGFKTYVVIDACAGVSHDGIRSCIEKWKSSGITLITSDEIVEENKEKSTKEKETQQEQKLRRSARVRRPPNRYSDAMWS